MKTTNQKSMNPQVRFTLTLNATWSVLRDLVLTKIYARQWKRYVTRATREIAPTERLLTLYGYIFNEMYREVQDAALEIGTMCLQIALRAGDGRTLRYRTPTLWATG